ncbi:hypothetical protein OS493_040385, partial [Desmophyllum pertusum]
GFASVKFLTSGTVYMVILGQECLVMLCVHEIKPGETRSGSENHQEQRDDHELAEKYLKKYGQNVGTRITKQCDPTISSCSLL